MDAIKALIFDLDDTLCDSLNLVKIPGIPQAIQHICEGNAALDAKVLIQKAQENVAKRPQENPFENLVELSQEEKTLAYEFLSHNADLARLESSPELHALLQSCKKKYRLFLVTKGNEAFQKEKIAKLDIESYFEKIYYDTSGDKKELIQAVSYEQDIVPSTIVVIGDRINAEIAIGNELGMHTIRVLQGSYAALEPQTVYEQADITINTLDELFQALQRIEETA